MGVVEAWLGEVADLGNWVKSRRFQIAYTGIQITDPSVITLPAGKSSLAMMTFAYEQNTIWALYSDSSLADFYTSLAAETEPLVVTYTPVDMPAGIYDIKNGGVLKASIDGQWVEGTLYASINGVWVE
jgi:hypothetical protein